MCESALLGRSSRPVLALHRAVVRGRATESDPISLIICANACERAAPSNSAFEMVNV